MVIITDEEIKQVIENERKAKFNKWRNEYLRERGAELAKERANRHQTIFGLEHIQEYSGVMGLDTINKI